MTRGEPPGVGVDEMDGGAGEDGSGGACHLEPVLDVGLGLQFVADQVEADGDLLPEGFEGFEPEGGAEFRLAYQDGTERAEPVHGEVVGKRTSWGMAWPSRWASSVAMMGALPWFW